MRRTKIVATIGPATSSEAAINALVGAGVDVFRLNFSHGTRESHGQAIAHVRAAAARQARIVGVLQDLAGPKIRTGPLKQRAPIVLQTGDELHIAVGDEPGEPGRISTAYAELPRIVSPGGTLLLDDGRIQLRVEEVRGSDIRTRVVDGGELGESKGINVPGVHLPSTGLTPKDVEDLRFGIAAGVDFVGLSFVQSAADVRQARERLRAADAEHISLVAKLERPDAVAHIEEIVTESDAVMIARGDLGLELPLERVPRVQKVGIRTARALGVPAIVATQVLESMRTEPRPTRAEVSDAANAVSEAPTRSCWRARRRSVSIRSGRSRRSTPSLATLRRCLFQRSSLFEVIDCSAATGARSAKQPSRWQPAAMRWRLWRSRGTEKPRGSCRRSALARRFSQRQTPLRSRAA